MQIVADLQLHSKYSRAVSQRMNLFEIASWASKKGLRLMATGDWQHPLYFKEILANLRETSTGIYELKKRPSDQKHTIQFLLSSEISSIYMQGGKQRRIHNLIFSPSIETCQKVIKALQSRGANLMADGRPIVGISSKDLLQMMMEIDEKILIIPAHVWTPWFGLLGSKSGFDSLEECFGNLAKYVYAIETGLSSDPTMNWQIKELDNRSILSFSDAHSGPKLGREATVFVSTNPDDQNTTYTYDDITDAIKQNPDGKLKVGYTIEFFPEEGKYHWSGHRSCGIRYDAIELKEKGTTCPVCKRGLTVGVENRVLDLSYKHIKQGELQYLQNNVGLTFVCDPEKKRRPFVSLVPLLEILLELQQHSQTKAQRQYEELTTTVGTEFDILLRKPYNELEEKAGKNLRDAIQIMRERKVVIDPGYDGVFGTVKIFNEHPPQEEVKETKKPDENQKALF